MIDLKLFKVCIRFIGWHRQGQIPLGTKKEARRSLFWKITQKVS